MPKQFDNVDCRFGSPMGRSEYSKDFSGKARCFRVRFVYGDYDDGGCYWGGYNTIPLYCATNGDGFRMFSRQYNRKDAKKNFEARAFSHSGQKIKWIN